MNSFLFISYKCVCTFVCMYTYNDVNSDPIEFLKYSSKNVLVQRRTGFKAQPQLRNVDALSLFNTVWGEDGIK